MPKKLSTIRYAVIAHEQGWNDETMLDLAIRFINEQQRDAAFVEFLHRIADEENAMEEEDDADHQEG